MPRVVVGALVLVGTVLVAHQVLLASVAAPALVAIGTTLIGLPLVLGAEDSRHPRAIEQAPEEEPVEVEPPDSEVVDRCGHDAPAAPVEADVTGDFETEVVGWLCTADGCLQRVSHAAAVERNLPYRGVTRYTGGSSTFGLRPHSPSDPLHILRLRLLVDHVRSDLMVLGREWKRIPEGEPIPDEEYQRYVTLMGEGERRSAILREAEARAAALVASGVRCKGYREERRGGGSVVRVYAVPGECLCGGCPTPDASIGPKGDDAIEVHVETERYEVKAWGSDVPVRTYETSTFYQKDPPGFADEADVWIDPEDGGAAYRWTDGAWVRIVDTP